MSFKVTQLEYQLKIKRKKWNKLGSNTKATKKLLQNIIKILSRSDLKDQVTLDLDSLTITTTKLLKLRFDSDPAYKIINRSTLNQKPNTHTLEWKIRPINLKCMQTKACRSAEKYRKSTQRKIEKNIWFDGSMRHEMAFWITSDKPFGVDSISKVDKYFPSFSKFYSYVYQTSVSPHQQYEWIVDVDIYLGKPKCKGKLQIKLTYESKQDFEAEQIYSPQNQPELSLIVKRENVPSGWKKIDKLAEDIYHELRKSSFVKS